MNLIELRDYDLAVRNPDGLLARSPGFASIAGDMPVFGDAARQQARRHPRHSFNQFWSQLSLDPLPIKNKFFRHAADLAYSQLDGLTRPLALDEVIIAAPGSYNRSQLAVLLGIVKQCAFKTAGLVDAALLQAAGSAADECIIIDLQLHQALLTRFRRAGGFLLREQVVPVASAGLLSLQDAWLNLIAEEFIQQSRFDPQRDAETEQFLADKLAEWIAASRANGEVTIDINLRGSVHQARLTPQQFEQRAQGVFSRIAAALETLRGPGTALHASASQVNLPGFTQHIGGLIAIDDEQALASCVQHADLIRRDPDNLQFVTRLPLSGTANAAPAPAQTRMPTHVVLNNRALLLPQGRLTLGMPPAGIDSARIVPLADGNFSGAIALVRGTRGVQLELHTNNSVVVNGNAAQNGQTLALGDRVQAGNGPVLQLIFVEQTA